MRKIAGGAVDVNQKIQDMYNQIHRTLRHCRMDWTAAAEHSWNGHKMLLSFNSRWQQVKISFTEPCHAATAV